MIKIKNNKLCAGGVCFSLPDDFFIDPYPQIAYEDGISLYSSDKSYYLSLFAARCDGSAYTYLSNFITDSDYTVIEPIQKIIINGMTGYHAVFHSEKYSYYEAVIETPASSQNLNAFQVRIILEGVNVDLISELAHSEKTSTILNGIF